MFRINFNAGWLYDAVERVNYGTYGAGLRVEFRSTTDLDR